MDGYCFERRQSDKSSSKLITKTRHIVKHIACKELHHKRDRKRLITIYVSQNQWFQEVYLRISNIIYYNSYIIFEILPSLYAFKNASFFVYWILSSLCNISFKKGDLFNSNMKSLVSDNHDLYRQITILFSYSVHRKWQWRNFYS